MIDGDARVSKYLSHQIPFIHRGWIHADAIDTIFEKLLQIDMSMKKYFEKQCRLRHPRHWIASGPRLSNACWLETLLSMLPPNYI